MDLSKKIEFLMSQAIHDIDVSLKSSPLRPVNIRKLYVKSGSLRLFRILMSNACVFNCLYCPMRRDRNLPRYSLDPDTLARVFMQAVRRGWVDGLFVTTAIPDSPVKVMDRVVQLLSTLRRRWKYTGYIHVKIVPGADEGHLEIITRLADRVSVNLETPCGERMRMIAPQKSYTVHENLLVNVLKKRLNDKVPYRNHNKIGGLRAGVTTQFVVGAAGESDREILSKSYELIRKHGLHHTHFAAFRPIRDTPLENHPETPSLRERRLYEADYLFRYYRFTIDELPFDDEGFLTLRFDLKTEWALKHPEFFPLHLEKADYEALLRVPGIGPITARRIIQARRKETLRDERDLQKLGLNLSKSGPFLLFKGRVISRHGYHFQPALLSPAQLARKRTYEVSPGTFR